MPADLVTGENAEDVAAYVASAAANPGEDTGRLASAGAAKQEELARAKGGTLEIPADPSGRTLYTFKDAEAPAGERRDRMVASFNRGYRGFQQTYRTCTPAAGVAIRRYLDEGARIARDITGRYAN